MRRLDCVRAVSIVNKNTVMLARLKKVLDVIVKIILCLDVPKRLFLLIYIDDIYILLLRMSLDKVLENITLTDNKIKKNKYFVVLRQ